MVAAAGWLTAANGAAHLVLPLYFPWDTHVTEFPAPGVALALPVFSVVVAALLIAGLVRLWPRADGRTRSGRCRPSDGRRGVPRNLGSYRRA
jgi:hypothetical protein